MLIDRASATRFFIPPDSSEGISSSTPSSSTRPSLARTISRMASSSRSVCSRSPYATFSRTFIESNSAPPWNSIATFFRIGISASSSYPPMSSPSTTTRPRSGRWSPMMCRIRTDLPLPLPPSTTIVSPRRMSKVIPPSTCLLPNALCTSSNLTKASSICGRSEREKELRQEKVGDQHAEGGGDHGLGGGPADTVRTARSGQPAVTRDQPDEQREESRLAEPAQDIVQNQGAGHVLDVEGGGLAQRRHRHHQPPHDTDEVGEDHQERQHDDDRQHLRHHELPHGARGHGADGVDLLRHLHGADLGRDPGSHPPAHHEGGEHGTQLPHQRQGHHVPDEEFRPVGGERVGGLERQDHPREQRRDRG